MKSVFRIVAAVVLLFSISLTVPAKENARADGKKVEDGFYISNELIYNLKDFQKSSKKEKKKIIKEIMAYQNYLVMGNQVYDFNAAASLPAGQSPIGISIAEYEKVHGELKQPTATFNIVSID